MKRNEEESEAVKRGHQLARQWLERRRRILVEQQRKKLEPKGNGEKK